jgi:hypothetical protein
MNNHLKLTDAQAPTAAAGGPAIEGATLAPPKNQHEDHRSSALIQKLLRNPLVQEAFIRLQVELPDGLYYHSL